MAHRMSVSFSDDAYRTLEELARRKGTTMSEVLRDAISLEAYAEKVREEGNRLLVEDDGKFREIVIR